MSFKNELNLKIENILEEIRYKNYIRFEVSKWSYSKYRKHPEIFFKNVTDKVYNIFKNFEYAFDILKVDIFLDYSENKIVMKRKIKKAIKEVYDSFKISNKISKPNEIIYNIYYDEYDGYKGLKIRLIWNLKIRSINFYNVLYEISKTDFGGCKYLCSYTTFIDSFNNIAFNFYDDRGLDIFSDKKEILFHFYKKYNKYILDYNRDEIDKIFNYYNNDKVFEIYVHKLYWIDEYEEENFWLYGDVTIRLGCEIFNYSTCVSIAIYRFFETLEKNHYIEYCDEQILPCCGYFYIDNNNLNLNCCGDGIDFNIEYFNNNILISTEKDSEYIISFDDYKYQVLKFASIIKEFYSNSKDKVFENEDKKNIYIKYWKEFDKFLEKLK